MSTTSWRHLETPRPICGVCVERNETFVTLMMGPRCEDALPVALLSSVLDAC